MSGNDRKANETARFLRRSTVAKRSQLSLHDIFVGVTLLASTLGAVLAWPKWTPEILLLSLFAVVGHIRRRGNGAIGCSKAGLLVQGILGGIVDGGFALFVLQFICCAVAGIAFDLAFHATLSLIGGLSLGIIFPKFFRKFTFPMPF